MNKSTRKLLVIGHVWPQPKASAAGEHMLHLIQLFKDMCYQVHFATAAQQPPNYSDLDTIDIITDFIELNNDNFNDYLLKVSPDIVLFDRFMVEEQFSWRVKQICPNALRILDTEDIHFLRKERELNFKGKINEGLSDIAKREISSIYRCDLSLVISEFEIDLLTKEYAIPQSLLCYLPLLSNEIRLEDSFSFNERKDVMFVGNFLHEPNWQAVQTLKKEIWPLVREQNKELQLHIYGAYAAEKHKQLNNPKENFYVHGYIDDIEAVIKKTRLLVAPIYIGAGQKGKLLKAMQCGTPSITTSIGVESMQFEKEWPGVIADDFEIFTKQLLKIYSDKTYWEKKQRNILPLVNEHFQYKSYLPILNDRLNLLFEQKEKLRAKNIIGEILWHNSMRSTEFMSRWIMEKNK